MKMNKLTILTGPPGSGKSTLARNLRATYDISGETVTLVNKDILRSLVTANTSNFEKHVDKLQTSILSTVEGNVILDNTNCRISRLKEIIDANKHRFEIELIFVGEHLTLKDLYDINVLRPINKKVPTKAIDSFYSAYKHLLGLKAEILNYIELANKESKESDRTYSNYQQSDLPKAVIVDIDGTVAHMVDRSPYDHTKVNEDLPDHNIIELINVLDKDFYNIIFVSGRSEECRDSTIQWLSDNNVEFNYQLFMREKGNYEKDSSLKKRLYEDNIKEEYDVRFVLDDRNSVVKLWRSLGLKCLQVEEGNF